LFFNITKTLQKKVSYSNWRSLLHAKYFSGDKMKANEWAGHMACMGDRRGPYRVLVRRPEGKRPLGITTRRCVDNIKIDLQVEWQYMDWIGTVKGRDRRRDRVNTIMILRVP
jgi:hypothetical protein